MTTTHITTRRTITSILLLLLMTALPAQAADECEVFVSYTNSNGSSQSQSVTLDEGEVRALGRTKVRYVKNKKNYPVRVEITNLWPPYGNKWVELSTLDQQDPPSGTYGADVTLYNVECGGTSFFPTPEQMVNTLKASGVPVDQIASGLRTTFNQTGQQAAQLLEDAGFTAGQIAGALREAFDAGGQQVAQWMADAGIWARYVAVGLEEAFNASGEQVATWLRQAGYNVGQVTQGLIEAFNASAEQTAAWLAAAGYSVDQIARALQDKFNATAEAFIDALRNEVCGVAGCPSDVFRQMVQALQNRFNQTAEQAMTLLAQAGYTASAIAEALREVYNASGQQIAQWFRQANVAAAQVAQALKDAFNASGEQVATWMRQAGYSINEVALALREGLNLSVEAAAQILETVFDASVDTIQAALEAAGYAAAEINQWLVSQITISQTYTGHASHMAPAAAPAQNYPFHVGRNQITIAGAGLLAVTSINGLPGTARIVGRGNTRSARGNPSGDYLQVEVDVPTRTRTGTTGRALLSVGSTRGPSFNWIVAASSQDGRSGGRNAGSGTPVRGAARPDLSPLNIQNVLYKVGAATTTDDDGDIFTALDPFNDSPHCQGIPQGTVNRRTNQPTSNTERITVPDVRWGVANTSGVDITETFTVRLLHGRREVARQTVRGLDANETATFTYRRPQSTTTVARVGLGGGCYHVGQAREGWNDNDGYTVEVDVTDDVSETRESNNRRILR